MGVTPVTVALVTLKALAVGTSTVMMSFTTRPWLLFVTVTVLPARESVAGAHCR